MTSDDHAESEVEISCTFICSVFELANRAGYFVPPFNFRYDEAGAGVSWFITGGGTRLYLSRVGDKLEQAQEAQAADSHFMVDRAICALLISGAGLFSASPKGRIFVEAPVKRLRWQSQINQEPFYSERVRAIHDAFDETEFGGWLVFICQNSPIRRALHDAVQALQNPTEAFVYIYRGFEWIRKGLNLTREEIAADVGVSKGQLKKLGQIANDESGVRHASKTGVKQRASMETYSTWIAGLIAAIEASRARIDKTYSAANSKRVAEKLKVAVQYNPYP